MVWALWIISCVYLIIPHDAGVDAGGRRGSWVSVARTTRAWECAGLALLTGRRGCCQLLHALARYFARFSSQT
jgi:hypothetical protein